MAFFASPPPTTPMLGSTIMPYADPAFPLHSLCLLLIPNHTPCSPCINLLTMAHVHLSFIPPSCLLTWHSPSLPVPTLHVFLTWHQRGSWHWNFWRTAHSSNDGITNIILTTDVHNWCSGNFSKIELRTSLDSLKNSASSDIWLD